MSHARASASLAAIVALAFAADARAETAVSLRWTAPEGCPTEANVRAEIDRLLGDRASTRPDTGPLEVRAAVERMADGRFRVHLETQSAQGPRVREVEATSCTALGEAAALIIAMMIEPSVLAEPPPPVPPPPEPQPLAPPTLPPGPEGQPLAPPTLPPTETPPVALFTRVLGDIGSFPGPMIAFGGGLAFFLDRFRFEAGLTYVPDHTFHFPALSSAGADLNLTLAHVGSCVTVWKRSPFELAPCVSFEAGRLQGASFGLSSPGQAAAAWLAGSAGGRFAYTFAKPFSLVARLGAGVPIVHPEFRVGGLGPVHRASPVVGRLELGVEVRL